MRYVITIFLVALALYIFFALIREIDFSGMNLSEAKFIISVCVGVAASVISVRVGINIIYAALVGFVAGAILYALILYVIGIFGGPSTDNSTYSLGVMGLSAYR